MQYCSTFTTSALLELFLENPNICKIVFFKSQENNMKNMSIPLNLGLLNLKIV